MTTGAKLSSSQIVTTIKPTPRFLQAGCPSRHPNNSVRALKESHGKYAKCKVQNHSAECITFPQKMASTGKHPPDVTNTENRLSTMQSMMASISVSLTSPLFMAETQHHATTFTNTKTE